MAKLVSYLVLVLLSAFFISCNKTSKNIEDVKLFPVKAGEAFEYIDRDGKIVINPQFREACVFREGLALVESSGTDPKWGYIDEHGKYAISAKYKSATIFSEGLAWVVSENSAPSAISKGGEVKFMLQKAQDVRIFHGGLAAFSQSVENGPVQWGFVDKSGSVKINPQFVGVGDFQEGKCVVNNKDGKYGYIDETGKLIINNQFDGAGGFINGRAIVTFGGKWGVIDEKGGYVINPQFENIRDDGDLFLIEQDGKFGWTDRDGKITINPQFAQAFPFTNGDLAAVKSGDNWGYIDKDGKITINAQFNEAYVFNGNLAIVASSKKVGMIDKTGKYVINPQFDGVSLDLVTYLINGTSPLASIATDYFDISPILDRIKNGITEKTVEGITFDTPIQTILNKYNININAATYFSVANQQLSLFRGERISNNAVLEFKLSTIPINQNPQIDQFIYSISLSGNAFNKTEVLKNAFQTAFSGFVKDNQHSNPNFIELMGSALAITIYATPGSGTIEINVSTLESAHNFNAMPGD
jgi:hypothetical protein